ncbi:MAG: CBS domain-containing protein [Acidimicrobiales bacterium]
MARPRLVLADDVSQVEARRLLTEAGVNGAPVVDGEGKFLGVVAAGELASPPEPVVGVVDAHVPVVSDSAHLDAALDALATSPHTWIPVLDSMHQVVGTLADSDVVRGYRLGLRAALGHVGVADVDAGSRQVEVGASSPLADLTLREAPLPAGILVTLIRRGKSSIEPDGETFIRPGDELVLVCREEDQDELARLAGGAGGAAGSLEGLEPS